MGKFNINIGGLSPKENQKINDAVNQGKKVHIESEQELPPVSDTGTKSSPPTKSKTVIHQTVHQYGENNYTFDKPVSGMHIGEIIKE